MVIGLSLCVLSAIISFFKTEFQGFIPKAVAIVLLSAIVGCSFIPSFTIGSVIVNGAVFIAPLIAGFIVMLFIPVKKELAITVLAILVCASLCLSIRCLLLQWQNSHKDLTLSILVGVITGVVAYLVAKTKASTVSAILVGVPLGDVIASLLLYYFLDENALVFGSEYLFDAIMIAVVIGIFINFAVGFFITRKVSRQIKENQIKQSEVCYNKELIDDDYKQYFDD